MMCECCLMEKTREPDGAGGFLTSWTEGAPFKAAITLDTTMQARVAEKEGVSSVYTITTSRSVKLDFHDAIKRLEDGKIFRITSNQKDKMSPAFCGLDMAQATAEGWSLS